MRAPARATVITDASYCHETKVGGYGAWITMDGNNRILKSGVIKGPLPNSTHAELKAVMIGIWLAYQAGARQLLVQTDCMAVVEVLQGKQHGGQADLRRIFREARAIHFPDCSIKGRHVKGHTRTQDARSHVNRWCDEHAGKAMRDFRKRKFNVVRRADRATKAPDAERFATATLKLGASAP